LSTLHTNTAVGAITRLIDMGVEPFLISSSLIGIAAQRLVRVLCEDCKQPYTPDATECEFLQKDPDNPPTIYQHSGCENCNQLGYRGRMGIYEIIGVDEGLRTLIHDQAGEMVLERAARERGPSIHADGVSKIINGTTTVEEVLRVTHRG